LCFVLGTLYFGVSFQAAPKLRAGLGKEIQVPSTKYKVLTIVQLTTDN